MSVITPPRSLDAIKEDLAEAGARLTELRMSPDFLSCHSEASQEHRWVSIRLATVRGEYNEATGRHTRPGA